MPVLVFDIETIPDVNAGRKLYGLDALHSDKDVATQMFAARYQRNHTEFLAHHLHQIVAISVVLYTPKTFNVWSLGDADSSERTLIERFYQGLERYTPTLVSWNGGGFDLPVLNYRSLVNKVSAPVYWESGDHDTQFKWNNYLNRYHSRHTDLMDVLAGFTRAVAPLDQVASMLGYPGKMGISGANVWDYYQNGKIKEIRDYCETDVLNTYLVYCRYEFMRGNLTETQLTEREQQVKIFLNTNGAEHFVKFSESMSC